MIVSFMKRVILFSPLNVIIEILLIKLSGDKQFTLSSQLQQYICTITDSPGFVFNLTSCYNGKTNHNIYKQED